jgi:membrane associated rhomboid family serine protease
MDPSGGEAVNSYALKVKLWLLVSVPATALGLVLLYSAFDWLAVQSGLVPLDKDLTVAWIPIVLAVAATLLIVQPRISTLALSRWKALPGLYLIVAVAAVAAPAILAQFYVRSASGTLVHVGSAGAIADAPAAKYYKADLVCLDRERAIAQPVVEADGRDDEDLDVTLYVAVPLCEGGSVWIGYVYTDVIDNRMSDAKKDAAYDGFLKSSNASFDAEDTSRYTYLERLGPSGDKRGFERMLAKHGVTGDATVVLPRTAPFEARTGNFALWTLAALLIGTLAWTLMVLVAPVDFVRLAQVGPGSSIGHVEATHPGRGNPVLGALFIPSMDSFGVQLLIDANILVYLAMVLSGAGVMSFDTQTLVEWGGNYGPLDHGWGLLRLFSCQFVHGGFGHIANNMYGLLFAGLVLSPVAKNTRLIFAYLATGLGGSLASVAMHPDIVSVGASGAIFGLFGVALALGILGDSRLTLMRRLIFVNVAVYMGINLVLGWTTPGIDNSAHVGGALTGVALGWLFHKMDGPAASTTR